MNRKNTNNSQDFSLNLNGKSISDPNQVANAFNNFFTSIAQNLDDKLGNTDNHFTDYLKNRNSDSFFILPVTPDELHTQLSCLDINKAPDAYDIPVKLVKCVSDVLTTPLTKLINESFQLGHFPSMLKYAKVIPIFKAKSRDDVSNYRPIPLLPIFNKIFEKLMHIRLTDFLVKHNIIF